LENVIFEYTGIGGVKLDDAEVELKNNVFIDPWEIK
jgi:hypothetical protein